MASRQQVLNDLTLRLRELERHHRPKSAAVWSPAIAGLEPLLPAGQLATGTLLELLASEEGVGVVTLALALAQSACATGRSLLIADPEQSFYPPAAWGWGPMIARAIVVRAPAPRDALHALTQGLRCPAIGAAIGWHDQIASADYRRLQLAAETGGGLGIVLRPGGALGQPSFAALRWRVSPLPSVRGQRRLAVEALRLRGAAEGRRVCLEIDDETNTLRVSAPLADTATPANTAGAAG